MFHNYPVFTGPDTEADFLQLNGTPWPDGLGRFSDVALGPYELNDSRGTLLHFYWCVKWEHGVFKLYRWDGFWVYHNDVLAEPNDIVSVSLTFDQLGRICLFYQLRNHDLKLYWYDSTAQAMVLTTLTKGRAPVVKMDLIYNLSDPSSDIILFYLKGWKVYTRIQRERYDVEHFVMEFKHPVNLKTAGMCVDYRYRLVYQIPDSAEGKWIPEGDPSHPGWVSE